MSALASAVPFIHMGELPIGIPIQAFGLIVAIGVLIGAALLRRYAEWHGVSDEIIRGLLGWVTVCGFIGAHEFDMIAYNWDKIGDPTMVPPASWWPGFLPPGMYPSNWPLPLKLWEGISSYGGFLGGALGFAFFVWWKRLPPRLFADITIVGLLPAFSIGRIGCTVVSDHIGAAVDPSKWYAFLAMDYPRKLNMGHLAEHYPGTSEYIKAWNLGFVELLYLIPVNAFVLWLAFKPKSKGRPNAGMITVVTGILYAPVRFAMDYLRPEDSDPRHFGLTFAQWVSILAFGVAIYAMFRILKNGKPDEPLTETSGEMQHRLKLLLKEEESKGGKEPVSPPVEKKAPVKSAEEKAEEKEEEELAKEALAAKAVDDAPADDEEPEPGDEPASPSPPVGAAKKPKYQTAGSKKKNKKKR